MGKNKKTPVNNAINELHAEEQLMIKNGLQEALFGQGGPGGIGGNQLSQVDTFFQNTRWYLISNMRQILSEVYVEHGIIQTIVDVPVDDAFRGGIIVETQQLDEKELKTLHNTMEREDDIGTLAQANKWKRLFGGSAVLVITDQDPAKELDMKKIKVDSPLEFRAVDLWELYSDMGNVGDYHNAKFADDKQSHFMYYSQKVHKSRVLKMKGLKAPSFVRPRLRGWGFSVVESIVRSVNQYLKSTDLTFEVLDEHKLDIFKIKGLTSVLAQKGGAEAIQKRVALANQQKNYQNALTMDAEDDYVQKELSFGGISEVMTGIRMQVASDLRMPLTKVFGISAAGFSSGEDDIENYNAMVESTVRQSSKFDALRMIEIRCQQLFGFVPDDLTIEFKPLRVLSSEAEENVKTSKFARISQARSSGEMSSEEFKDACNKDNLLGVQLDISRDTLHSPQAQAAGGDAEVPPSGLAAKAAPEVKNSLGYEVAVYDTGLYAERTEQWKKRKYDNASTDADKPELWAKCALETAAIYGGENWQFTLFLYERRGGKFK